MLAAAAQTKIEKYHFAEISPELHPELLSQCGEHLLVRGVHFFGFEGAVGGAVLETVGDGLAVGGQFLARGVGEDVEALEADEQRLSEFLEDVFDVRVGQGGREFHGGVARGAGELREILYVFDAGEELAEFG